MKDFITEQHQQDALTALAKMVSHPRIWQRQRRVPHLVKACGMR